MHEAAVYCKVQGTDGMAPVCGTTREEEMEERPRLIGARHDGGGRGAPMNDTDA